MHGHARSDSSHPRLLAGAVRLALL
jgi:hypothetical protein